MQTSDLTLLTFTVCNGLRAFAYVPQIISAVRDKNRCAGISCTTWGMFFSGHLSTLGYSLVNTHDTAMATASAVNAACCLVILAVAQARRHSVTSSTAHSGEDKTARPTANPAVPAAAPGAA